MGHWMLEIAKFGMYVSLPLGTFIVFNSPSFYTPVLYEWRKKNQQSILNGENLMEERNRFLQKMRESSGESRGT